MIKDINQNGYPEKVYFFRFMISEAWINSQNESMKGMGK